jgi:hypothetical protein
MAVFMRKIIDVDKLIMSMLSSMHVTCVAASARANQQNILCASQKNLYPSSIRAIHIHLTTHPPLLPDSLFALLLL